MTGGTCAAPPYRPSVPGMVVISASGLRKCYGDRVAVAGIDLDVAAGQLLALLGPNGAGKTSTVEMLLGLRTPTSGSVRLLGGSPTSAAVRARVGAMLQEYDAPASLTVAETVSLVAHYYPRPLRPADVLARVGLAAARDQRIGRLSGGQRQRLSFALALVGDPELLFLDEPTAALDVAGRHELWDQVHELAGRGRTVLFSTHNLHEADEHADRVLVLDRGRVVKDGTPSDVRAVVAGRSIRLRTDATARQLSAMPEVLHVAVAPGGSGGLCELVVQATAAEPVLARLFAAGRQVRDLTVTDAGLEAAFLHLTGAGHHEALAGRPA